MIAFDQSISGNLEQALRREWLETNGLGGFASSTVAGCNTRRYHGLLTAATNPPVGRMLLLSKLEETLVIAGERIDLGTNQYDSAIHPQGYQRLVAFRLDPFPVFTFETNGVVLEKAVFMLHGSNTTVVQYRVLAADGPFDLELRPLIAFRDYHSTTHENSSLEASIEQQLGLASVAPYAGLPRLYFAHNAAEVSREGYWYRGFVYAVERERGLDFVEDLFNPLVLRFRLQAGQTATVIASTEAHDAAQADAYREHELQRRAAIARSVTINDDSARRLAQAADQYLVRRGEGWTVIAGYPWFTDWGRDTMIALPGLTLFTGRADVARSVLETFAASVDQGMLPNRFPDRSEAPEFNTVDATLWYFEAVRAYAAQTGDYDFVRERLYSVLDDIIAWHVRGTRYGIRMMDSGLLNAGESGVQLTWMDAKIGDWVVTPRSGKPVEIQALWFNAVKIMENFAARFGREADQRRFGNIATLAQWTFNRTFWNERESCLYDVVNGVPDGSIRPNQILAVSLPHTMMSNERARSVVDVVERDLLTPYGLRSLSPRDPRYAGRYEGDARSRDAVYHQGTVWPWLLGPFVTAYVKVNGGTKAARQRAREILRPLEQFVADVGCGQVPEIFDGDTPQRPRGCFAQAWSVAELLRALCQDVARAQAAPRRRQRPARAGVA